GKKTTMAPRCFIVRHGETEWSLNGRHTGTSDLPLTANGEKRVKATGKALVGDDRLIVPKNLVHVYVSPRTRAQRTLELLKIGCRERLPWNERRKAEEEDPIRTDANVEITEAVREWDYGHYEGLTSKQIQEERERLGLGPWNIWTDGCPGGRVRLTCSFLSGRFSLWIGLDWIGLDGIGWIMLTSIRSPDDIVRRLDAVIADIREKYHRPCFENPDGPGDVLVVAHGHILRAFAMRWTGKPLTETAFILEAGGVGTLSYEHHNIEEPAIILGGGFVVE
ncbi:uncharacterized protein N7443_006360, partial [Penicillium atrosanguineum]|uniref:uncharacterized protein n=1 Tax=Penicillium atrosanguineum TaxID=1132637 RepID=UPI0023A5C687